jgi:hypothetical protein
VGLNVLTLDSLQEMGILLASRCRIYLAAVKFLSQWSDIGREGKEALYPGAQIRLVFNAIFVGQAEHIAFTAADVRQAKLA